MRIAVACALAAFLGACGAGVDVADVEVTLGEWFVLAEPRTVEAGTLRLDLRNDGGAHHALTICPATDAAGCDGPTLTHAYVRKPEEARAPEELPDETDAPVLGAGWTSTVEVSLAPGTYRLFCPIVGHPGRGMQSLLHVEEAGGG